MISRFAIYAKHRERINEEFEHELNHLRVSHNSYRYLVPSRNRGDRGRRDAYFAGSGGLPGSFREAAGNQLVD